MGADRFVLQISPKILFQSAHGAVTLPRVLLKGFSNDCVQIAPKLPAQAIRTHRALLAPRFAADLPRCNHVRGLWSIVFGDRLDQICRGVWTRTRRIDRKS